jgi:hypothetical protein
MGMQSYGSFELKADIPKINEITTLTDVWDKIQNLMDETKASYYDIVVRKDNDPIDKKHTELNKVIKEYIKKIHYAIDIDIYPTYIPQEAEGTEYAGKIIWCISPILVRKVRDYSTEWEVWSELQ